MEKAHEKMQPYTFSLHIALIRNRLYFKNYYKN